MEATPFPWELRCQVFVDGVGRFAAFGDRPDHQRLSAPHVARGKNARHRGMWFSSVATLPRWSSFTPSCSIMPLRTGPRKPMASSTRSASRVNSVPGIGSKFGVDARRVQLLHVALVAGELERRDAPVAHAAFFVRAFDAQLHRPQRPGRRWRALVGRLRQQFELRDRARPGGGRCRGNRRRYRRRR